MARDGVLATLWDMAELFSAVMGALTWSLGARRREENAFPSFVNIFMVSLLLSIEEESVMPVSKECYRGKGMVSHTSIFISLLWARLVPVLRVFSPGLL